MAEENSFRWQNFLWSVVTLFALTLFAYIQYSRSNNLISFGIFAYFVWPYLISLTVLILILRYFNVIYQGSFFYIFIGTTNIYIGGAGLYLIATSDVRLSFFIHGMFYLNILFATFTLFDIFGSKKPR